jgi:hypothetical protein
MNTPANPSATTPAADQDTLAFLAGLQCGAPTGYHRDLRLWVDDSSSVAKVLRLMAAYRAAERAGAALLEGRAPADTALARVQEMHDRHLDNARYDEDGSEYTQGYSDALTAVIAALTSDATTTTDPDRK